MCGLGFCVQVCVYIECDTSCPPPTGTSPHAPAKIHVSVSTTSANVSWEPSYDGGFAQTFSVWYGHV